jgi:hypothetical protein
MEAVARRWCWRLGVKQRGAEADAALVAACEKTLRETKAQPDAFFHTHRGGRNAEGELSEALSQYSPVESDHDYWRESEPQSMLIDEVETLWSAIDERDDWQPLNDKIEAIRRMGDAHGPAPRPAGHADENSD